MLKIKFNTFKMYIKKYFFLKQGNIKNNRDYYITNDYKEGTIMNIKKFVKSVQHQGSLNYSVRYIILLFIFKGC